MEFRHYILEFDSINLYGYSVFIDESDMTNVQVTICHWSFDVEDGLDIDLMKAELEEEMMDVLGMMWGIDDEEGED